MQDRFQPKKLWGRLENALHKNQAKACQSPENTAALREEPPESKEPGFGPLPTPDPKIDLRIINGSKTVLSSPARKRFVGIIYLEKKPVSKVPSFERPKSVAPKTVISAHSVTSSTGPREKSIPITTSSDYKSSSQNLFNPSKETTGEKRKLAAPDSLLFYSVADDEQTCEEPVKEKRKLAALDSLLTDGTSRVEPENEVSEKVCSIKAPEKTASKFFSVRDIPSERKFIPEVRSRVPKTVSQRERLEKSAPCPPKSIVSKTKKNPPGKKQDRKESKMPRKRAKSVPNPGGGRQRNCPLENDGVKNATVNMHGSKTPGSKTSLIDNGDDIRLSIFEHLIPKDPEPEKPENNEKERPKKRTRSKHRRRKLDDRRVYNFGSKHGHQTKLQGIVEPEKKREKEEEKTEMKKDPEKPKLPKTKPYGETYETMYGIPPLPDFEIVDPPKRGSKWK